jgi:hypothetical protein
MIDLVIFVIAHFTHPVIASLDHPLFAARKEGFSLFVCEGLGRGFFFTLFAKQRGLVSAA